MRAERARTLFWLAICGTTLILSQSTALAQKNLSVNVRAVKATKDQKSVDSRLRDIAHDLRSVFNYTGFTLIKQSTLQLKPGQSGRVDLSAGLMLELMPLGLSGKRARLQVRIVLKGRETFKTVLLLVNRGSVLIGGPPYDNGVLLFSVSARF